MMALLGYYDCMWNGMRSEVGDIIFRISDLMDEEERRMILVYPNRDGSIDAEGGKWDSLEDWRQAWEDQRQEIATLSELWPEARNYLP